MHCAQFHKAVASEGNIVFADILIRGWNTLLSFAAESPRRAEQNALSHWEVSVEAATAGAAVGFQWSAAVKSKLRMAPEERIDVLLAQNRE